MEQRRLLTNLQCELLELFALDLPEEKLLRVRSMLAGYFAGKATEEMDRFIEKQGLTPEDLQRWAHEHERAHTDQS